MSTYSKDLEFWTGVHARQDALEQLIQIRRKQAQAQAPKKAPSRRERLHEARALLPPPGSPPYAFRTAYERAGERPVSRAEVEEAREIFFRRASIRKADAGGLEGMLYDTVSEYACGIYAFEMRDARRKAFSRSTKSGFSNTAVQELALVLGKDATGDGTDNGAALAYGPVRGGPLPVAYTEWRQMGFTVQRQPMPVIITKDRKMLERILAQSPGRRQGRPPLDGKAMTDAQRAKKYRARRHSRNRRR